MSKRALILANGKSPKKEEIIYLMDNGWDFLICADGGANSARKMELVPKVIIGDLDSISPKTKLYFSGKSEFIHLLRQNDTDVEKAIKYLIQHDFHEAILLGGTGNRLDHGFCNIGISLKFYDSLKLYILHRDSFLIPIEGENTFETQIGETISIYGIDKQTYFTSSGLKYALDKSSLPFGVRESTSNEAIKNRVTLTVEKGRGLMVREYKSLKENDYFRNS
ncbi:MAG: thiamine diphosphokinase [Melioribacteraceae bacterium]|nr:thiamine diphosphokinase [Melioribacteraceae bacterium]MCF8431822.1 thiamine diphosphokinase [Melioribacteraceae bacterium]